MREIGILIGEMEKIMLIELVLIDFLGNFFTLAVRIQGKPAIVIQNYSNGELYIK